MNPLSFTTTIGKTGVLRSVIVPPKIVAALGGGTRIPVVARYGDAATESTIVPAGGKNRRLVLQMSVLRDAGLDAGDRITITLTRMERPSRPPLPADLQRALQFRPAAAAELERSSPSTWRITVARLAETRSPETRQRLIERIVERLAENAAARRKKT